MANLVSFQSLTAAEYEALSGEYVDNRIYFITDIGEIKLNGVNYGGSKQEEPDYLTFTAETAGSTVALNKNTDDPSLSAVLEYSTDGETWTNYEWSGTAGTVITLANVGDYVKFRGDNATFSIHASSLYYLFAITGSVGASGNINTLMSKNGNAVLTTYCFTYLFKQCTGLTSAPELPATELADTCYFNMFNGCSGLTSAPELPATVLTNECYNRMFKDCTGLTSAPEMTATSFITDCYTQTFRNCASLSSVTVHWTTWPTYNESICTTNWLNGVAATGTFHCPADLTIPSRDANGVPEGWTIIQDVID